MSIKRARLAAGATVLALGALGGVALETNHGIPAATRQVAGGGSAPVVTSASGAAATPVAQPVGTRTNSGARPPISRQRRA